MPVDLLGDVPIGLVPEIASLSACLASKCQDACGLTCGGIIGDTSNPKAAVACQGCFTSTTCDKEIACASSPDCNALQRCFYDCRTKDCRDSCIDAHPASQELFGYRLPTTCKTQCGVGGNWTCVGHVNWPPAASATTAVTVEVMKYGTTTVLSGMTVTACSGTDPDCQMPLADAGTTDDSGMVTLEVPTSFQTFNPVGGYVQVTSPSTVPYLYFWVFPLTQPRLRLIDSSYDQYAELVMTPDAQQALWAPAVPMLDSTRGTVVVPVADCEGAAAPGVTVAYDSTDPAIVETDGVHPTATATGASGFVALANVPVGRLTLTAIPLSLGKMSSQVTVDVRAATQTTVTMRPTPLP